MYEVVGAAMEVYFRLGRGFLEPIYQEAFEIELEVRRIPFEPKGELVITYRDRPLNKKYVPDVVCFDKIIVELKALERLSSLEESQLLNYLKMTKMRVGLPINLAAEANSNGSAMSCSDANSTSTGEGSATLTKSFVLFRVTLWIVFAGHNKSDPRNSTKLTKPDSQLSD